jgi:hypothetical protein
MTSGAAIQHAEDFGKLGDDEIAARLAELTSVVNAGLQAQEDRAALIRYAVYSRQWTHRRVAAACPMSQPGVTQLINRRVKAKAKAEEKE